MSTILELSEICAEQDPDPKDQRRRLVALLESSFERFAALPAFTNLGTTLTFADVERQSRAFAAYLQSVPGLASGDRVALMSPRPGRILDITQAGDVEAPLAKQLDGRVVV